MKHAISAACVAALAFGLAHAGTEIWDRPAFSVPAADVVKAASESKAEPGADVLILFEERRYVLDERGAATQTHHVLYRVDSPDGVDQWSETGARFEPWYQARPEVRARVITADGAEHVLDPATLSDDPTREDRPDLYDDTRIYHGPLPAVAVGAIVEEEIVQRDTEPFFAAGVVFRARFGWSVPVKHARVVVDAPSSLLLRHVERLLPAATRTEEGGRTRLVVEAGPLEAQTALDFDVPGDVAVVPVVEFATGASWRAVAEEYVRLTQPRIRVEDVKSLVQRVSRAGDAPDRVVEKLVAALHKEVRYTGVEFDEASIVPRTPAETLQRKYGDCKDKAALLVAMLRASKVPAELALLSTGPGEDVAADLPGLGSFDHAIVHVAGPPELWIDATAETTRVGDLPFPDRGRLALLVKEGVSDLVKTPEGRPRDNLVVETREFVLSEYGPARIVETTETHGSAETSYRGSFQGPDKEDTRDRIEAYVKDVYLAEALTKLEHDDVADFSRPFQLRLEVERGKRGSTDLNAAVVVVRPESIADRLPHALQEPEDDEQDERPKAKAKARTTDIVFDPFVTEWRYRITPPPGFRLHALPENKTTHMGPATLEAEYTAAADGVVTAGLRFDVSKGRYTPEEASALRKALQEHRKAEPIMIGFDQTAYALLTAGKTKEALRDYEGLAARHPKEALHRVQVAQALLSVGLAEKARAEATKATKLDPTSALAFQTLGWVLQHDLVGRRFKKGFDLDGAVAAYRKAKELDPKNETIRADLAILLEEDAEGNRYSPAAKLDQAITEYRELKELQTEPGGLEDNVLFALLHAARFAELREAAAALPSTPTRQALQLAAVAASRGAPAAIEESARLTPSEATRSNALVLAGGLLIRIRHYPQAAELLTAGAQGQSNTAALLQQIELVRKTKRHDGVTTSENDPRGVIERFLRLVFVSGGTADARVFELFSKSLVKDGDREKALRDFNRGMGAGRAVLAKLGLPRDTLADMVVSTVKYSVDGDEATGYRVTMQSVGAPPQTFFLALEDGRERILGLGAYPSPVGNEVLGLVARGELATAKRWLDWVREEQHLQGQDDPLDGPVFPRFWTRGQDADRDKIRLAAASLLVTTDSARTAIETLGQGAPNEGTATERIRLDLALAYAYRYLQDYDALLPVAERLVEAEPGSATAFGHLTAAYLGLKRWDAWEQAARKRLERLPDDLPAIRSLGLRAAALGRFAEQRALIAPYLEKGKASIEDMNAYAWAALFTGTPGTDSVEAAERANSVSQNKSLAVLHTLACVYAEIGKTKEATDLLLQAMDAGGLEEPDSNIWYGFGRLAEQYGELDAAAAAYARIEKPERTELLPASTYALAQVRIKGLASASSR